MMNKVETLAAYMDRLTRERQKLLDASRKTIDLLCFASNPTYTATGPID